MLINSVEGQVEGHVSSTDKKSHRISKEEVGMRVSADMLEELESDLGFGKMMMIEFFFQCSHIF